MPLPFVYGLKKKMGAMFALNMCGTTEKLEVYVKR